jgi:8-oxo-dGTP pyrophosphatase MutT (NUDIX family)
MSGDEARHDSARSQTDAPGSPWKTLAACEAYRNQWITVTEYKVVRPDGLPGIYGVVDPHDNAAIVALDDEERVLLVVEFLYPLQEYAWVVPSGSVDDGEEPMVAARRELEEEAGYVASSWSPLGVYYLSSGISTQRSFAFLARGLQIGASRPEGTELLSLRTVPLAEARAMCLRNEIRDAPSVMAPWRAWEALHGDGG